ncbi:mannosyl-glycoprotein endo-beta-N-acetylglucosaminidase [Bacillus pakistanensis]|uniref:Mannosyl-glycoprotein endo-beta-N-acetylglucosaminidase n=2 Tax=Rossellomorea pakistanensis TaxID=992288 RepID=A0ABS2ND26_9BACI|nr:mannosyl-glycoprotein endo-beta-N-acetylglucosaminidase [Bacillus pakistanensis]
MVVLFQVLALLPSKSSAFSEEDLYKAIKLTEDIIISSTKGQELGEIYKNVILYSNKVSVDESFVLQWGNEEILITTSAFEVIEEEKPLKEEKTALGMIHTEDESIQIMNIDQEIVGEIKIGNSLEVFLFNQEYFYVLIGDQKFLVDRSKYEKYLSLYSNGIDEIENENVTDINDENANKDTSIVEQEGSTELTPSENQNEESTAKQPNEKIIDNEPAELNEQKSTFDTKRTLSFTSTSDESDTVRFEPDDNFFTVTTESVPIYDNSFTPMKIIGYLSQGEEYPRTRDYTSWHEIQFGDSTRFVPKEGTVPSDGKSLLNQTNGQSFTGEIQTTKSVDVYDNTGSSLVSFGTLKAGIKLPYIKEYTSWYSVVISGRVGFIKKSGAENLSNISDPNEFTLNDKYFRVTEDHQPIFEKRNGELVEVGYLDKGEYPRTRGYTNWHEIKFNGSTAFVHIDSTVPSDGNNITNLNNQYVNGVRSFLVENDVAVYDNTKPEGLVPFASLKTGVKYQVVNESEHWYRILISGLVGFVRKSDVKGNFLPEDKYFKVRKDTPVYDNRSGSLKQVGILKAGEVYPRRRDYTSWHQIQYSDFFAYVSKDNTVPDSGTTLTNKNTNWKNSLREFAATENIPVYDNTKSGPLIHFGTILEGEHYYIADETPSYWGVILADRIGWVKKENTIAGVIKKFEYTDYDISIDEFLEKQKAVNPQTDLYDIGYVSGDYIQTTSSTSYPKSGTVTDNLRIRSGPTTSGTTTYMITPKGSTLTLLREEDNGWYKVRLPQTWVNAEDDDILHYLDASNFYDDSRGILQFLVLSRNAGLPVSEINGLLTNKGILHGRGEAFIMGSSLYNINEVYLVSHALLETGNGSSKLATGIKVNEVDGKPVPERIVYNMYGIGAYDSDPLKYGAEFAYKQEWFTPEAAIIGGAKFIGETYIHNPDYQQDTLYEMRWNPALPATHQYATDIGWAYKQTAHISSLYSQLNSYILYLNIPRFLDK